MLTQGSPIEDKSAFYSIVSKTFEILDNNTLLGLRLVSHTLKDLATFAFFIRQYRYNGARKTDELFKMALDQHNRELTAAIINESFNMSLRYVDQKEKFLLGYASQFIDKAYQDELDEINLNDLLDNIKGYYPLLVLDKVTALLPKINEINRRHILNLFVAKFIKGIHFSTEKEFAKFKIQLITFLNSLTDENLELFFARWQPENIRKQVQLQFQKSEEMQIKINLKFEVDPKRVEEKYLEVEKLIEELKTGDVSALTNLINTESVMLPIEEVIQKFKTETNFGHLAQLKQRASELTQEQLLNLVIHDVPHSELEDFRTDLLILLADFAKHLNPKHQESMRNRVRKFLHDKDEQCFTAARIIAPYLTEDDLNALIDFAGSKLVRCYEYKKDQDWSAYRFNDFSYTLNLLKHKIPANKAFALFNIFKGMLEKNGFVEYGMNTGLRESITQLSQFFNFNEKCLSDFVNFVEEYLKLPTEVKKDLNPSTQNSLSSNPIVQRLFDFVNSGRKYLNLSTQVEEDSNSPIQDSASFRIIVKVLIDVIPRRLTEEQFKKLSDINHLQGFILDRLYFTWPDKISQPYLAALASRLSYKEAANVRKSIANAAIIAVNSYFKIVTQDDKENSMSKEDVFKKASENIFRYLLVLAEVASDSHDVKQFLQGVSRCYQYMTSDQIKKFFHSIPRLYRHADQEDRRTLYHSMSKFDDKYLYSSFNVVKKICNELPYDLLQHYLQRLMAVKASKGSYFPCHDSVPVLFKMIPLLKREDNLKLLDYLITQANTQRDADYSDLIFQMLKHNKCNMNDLVETDRDISSLKWGAKMLKVANLYQTVAQTNSHFVLFKLEKEPDKLQVGTEYKRKNMSPNF